MEVETLLPLLNQAPVVLIITTIQIIVTVIQHQILTLILAQILILCPGLTLTISLQISSVSDFLPNKMLLIITIITIIIPEGKVEAQIAILDPQLTAIITTFFNFHQTII